MSVNAISGKLEVPLQVWMVVVSPLVASGVGIVAFAVALPLIVVWVAGCVVVLMVSLALAVAVGAEARAGVATPVGAEDEIAADAWFVTWAEVVD